MDLSDFENNNRYSSFGRNVTKSQAPSYGFGTANRQQAQRVFRDKKLLEKCRESPGPKYKPDDNMILPRDPSTKIGTAQRQKLNTTLYDHYMREDIDFEPHKADLMRKTEATKVRFGLEQRFKTSFYSRNPGPQYELPSSIGKGPQYSMGVRRQHSYSVQGSTGEIVGPGAYRINSELTTHFEDPPKISFTKATKMQPPKRWDRHQTYFVQKSVGRQIQSGKDTKPAYSFGKSSKESQANILRQDLARQTVSIKIDHPKF